MEQWLTVKDVLADSERLWLRLIEGPEDTGFAVEVADSVLRLAIQGKVEIGEQDGALILRLPRQPEA